MKRSHKIIVLHSVEFVADQCYDAFCYPKPKDKSVAYGTTMFLLSQMGMPLTALLKTFAFSCYALCVWDWEKKELQFLLKICSRVSHYYRG